MTQVVCHYCKAAYKSFQNRCDECGAPILPVDERDTGDSAPVDSARNRNLWLSFGVVGCILVLAVGFWIQAQTGRSGGAGGGAPAVVPETPDETSRVHGRQPDSQAGTGFAFDAAAEMAKASPPTLAQGDGRLHAVDPAFRPFYQRALLANRIAALVPVRLMLNEFYMVTGKFPSSEREFVAEFGPESLAADEDFSGFTILDNGAVQAHLAPPFEDGKYLVLTPEISKRGSAIQWKCKTNLPQSEVGPRSGAICDSVLAGNAASAGLK